MKEKANYPNSNTKIDHFLAFRRKAKKNQCLNHGSICSNRSHLIVKCGKGNVTGAKINKTFHTADSFASSADKKQGTLSNLTHSLSVTQVS